MLTRPPNSPQHDPSNASAWIKFTELEGLLQDYDRVRAIYELAVDQPSMDMPELVWKSWIDFEYDVEDYERARDLYERLLRRTSHVKVWVSFAQFEANVGLAEAAALSGEGDDEDEEEEAGERREAAGRGRPGGGRGGQAPGPRARAQGVRARIRRLEAEEAQGGGASPFVPARFVGRCRQH